MVDITINAFVTRANLDPPLADLDINDGLNFVLGRGFRPGGVGWRHIHVTSPFVHGQVSVNSVKDATQSTLMVYVTGANMTELETNLDTIITAFTQLEFDLNVTVDGTVFRWTCERADYEAGLVTEHLAARYIPVAFSLFRHPVPVQGVV